MPKDASEYVALEEVPLAATWTKMEEAKKEGLAKHIGVSNFSETKLKNLIEKSKEIPEVNQVELHPLLQQNELKNYCDAHNIHLTAYSPLGSGDRAAAMKAENEPSLFDIEQIRAIANKHEVHPAEVLVSWHVHRGSAVIPKSVTPKNIEKNLHAANLSLDEEDLTAISQLDKHYRFITGKFFEAPEKGYINIYDE